ncbi:hypothetical protein Dtox_1726 [Desulfofarcimen acetoxidans DSM 771]|uniref:DUF5132 domain-containing protein n=1 Tax=Desulfofarcimen acetoxidans (strain ATCC 49208 / DSM 771 / KCTC 5769 / VKM B-1644 / 5575) TaxID=485916 RepID=C8VX07_DESAS|nr:hypothetical protein [Desulfofarcimen acetoxidans]ACV62583.1 hypothetical protein Dtox_1726 [Desulfofarcimen acetoxidans DSM 771]
MRWMRISSLEQFTPVGLIAAGILIGAGSPVIKKSLRGLAVLTTKGILTLADSLKESGDQLNNNWQQLVAEAREQQTSKFNLRDHLHTAGVTAVRGGLCAADEVQGMINQAREKISLYVEEARRELEKSVEQTGSMQKPVEQSESMCNCTDSNCGKDKENTEENYEPHIEEHNFDDAKKYKN